ncbi:MAG: alpha-amylase family glycosyl hydrolase [Ignavibacteria bacterium]|jgi:glycosidase
MLRLKSLLLLFTFVFSNGQEIKVTKIEPPNWWVGMKYNKIQLMVYGENLKGVDAKFENNLIKVFKVHKIENPTYAFIDIEIPDNLLPGNYDLVLSNKNNSVNIQYSINNRQSSIGRYQGFSNEDIMYLLMPDRFANGDTTNDNVDGYYDSMDTSYTQKRYGGDLQGIIDKLDYIKNFGYTSLWINPVIENNTFRSYHGYAATDYYKVDPRFGTNELYKELVDKAHSKGIKIILDHVSNHFSHDHYWIKNLPTKDWINETMENHLDASHHKMVYSDLYADSTTIKHVERGWFVDTMPDLNHENKFVQKYIIQNTLWWIEYSGLDGIREDTYPYCNQKFMAKWVKIILEEYPTLNIVGEVWTGDPAILAWYQRNANVPKAFNNYLPALIDFGLRDVLVGFLGGKDNLYHIYTLLAKDYLYSDPENLVTFIDNHDVARVMYYAKEDIAKAKIAYTILLTTRGIPCIFYGSELGWELTDDHGTLRKPFTGGFEGDERNAFTKEGRTDHENMFYDFIKQLVTLRKKYKSLQKGKLTHYPPKDNVYLYFRTLGEEKTMIIINESEEAKVVDLSQYLDKNVRLDNLLNQNTVKFKLGEAFTVPAKTANVYLVQ